MKAYGFIMARGGSKSVPRKNVKMIAGKPLIAWTILEARKAKLLDRIILSTDDEEIAAVGREYGAEVPFIRPAELAQDLTPDLPVFEHVIQWLKEHEGTVPDILVHLRPTSPLRRAEDIDKCVQLLIDHPEADSVRAVTPAPLHPMKTYSLEGDLLKPFIPEEVFGIKEPYNAPRQILPKAYASLCYLSSIRPNVITEKKSMTGNPMLGFTFRSEDALDIDSPEDWEIARITMENRFGVNGEKYENP